LELDLEGDHYLQTEGRKELQREEQDPASEFLGQEVVAICD
jgi:hypothetical protein